MKTTKGLKPKLMNACDGGYPAMEMYHAEACRAEARETYRAVAYHVAAMGKCREEKYHVGKSREERYRMAA